MAASGTADADAAGRRPLRGHRRPGRPEPVRRPHLSLDGAPPARPGHARCRSSTPSASAASRSSPSPALFIGMVLAVQAYSQFQPDGPGDAARLDHQHLASSASWARCWRRPCSPAASAAPWPPSWPRCASPSRSTPWPAWASTRSTTWSCPRFLACVLLIPLLTVDGRLHGRHRRRGRLHPGARRRRRITTGSTRATTSACWDVFAGLCQDAASSARRSR